MQTQSQVTHKRVSHKNKNLNSSKATIDIQHNQYIQQCDTAKGQLQRLEKEFQDIVSVIQELDNIEVTQDVLEKLLAAKDKKYSLEQQIKQLQEQFDVSKYFTKTANILWKYYDIYESGNAASEKPAVNDPNSILKYFTSEHCSTSSSPSPPSHILPVSKTSLMESYMKLTSIDYIDAQQCNSYNNMNDVCSHCGSDDVSTMVNDGYTVCNKCQAIDYIIVDHEKPSYRDPPKEISFYAYKRSNHLNEWLSQMQGKETTDIPEEVYDKILLEIKKQKISNMALITPKKIREILRKLQINKYEHIPHILNRLTGKPMMQMSPELEEKLRNMFKMIQAPFLRHAPINRKNFLSYSFVLHKLLQLLGEDDFLACCSLLKSKDKLLVQDQIWKKICDELNWDFIPSV
jgi:hypothetical protein